MTVPTKSGRPAIVCEGEYTAVLVKDEEGPWGWESTWEIRCREGHVVGKMFQGGGSYGEQPRCSLTKLVWSGQIPPGASDPKSPNYGICFDIGPQDTREQALQAFAKAADRLIAWRLNNPRA